MIIYLKNLSKIDKIKKLNNFKFRLFFVYLVIRHEGHKQKLNWYLRYHISILIGKIFKTSTVTNQDQNTLDFDLYLRYHHILTFVGVT